MFPDQFSSVSSELQRDGNLGTLFPQKSPTPSTFLNKGSQTEKCAHICTLSKKRGRVKPKTNVLEALFFCLDLNMFPDVARGSKM